VSAVRRVLAVTLLSLLFTACSGSASPTKNAAPTAHHLGGVNCTTVVAGAPKLDGVKTTVVSVRGHPFGVVSTANHALSFVSLDSSLAVLRSRSSPPVLDHQASVPDHPYGETLTHDHRYLLAANGNSGAVVLDVGRVETNAPNSVVGTLTAGSGGGAIEVAVSPDDHYAFVTLESNAEMAVFDLNEALTQGFGPQDLVGSVPLGAAPVGMAVSPDGKWLYATSEAESGQRAGVGRGQSLGTLSVIDLGRAETDPKASVVSTVTAGCSPVRVVVSSNGQTVWVTARGSDALLAFSAASLRSDPTHALIAEVRVGAAPVGLALVNGDSRIVVADSNRFGAGTTADLTVVNVTDALAHKPALLGRIPAGRFPREMNVAGNTLLVTNYASGQVEAVDLRTLP